MEQQTFPTMPAGVDAPRTLFNGQAFAWCKIYDELILVGIAGQEDPIEIRKDDLSFEHYKKEFELMRFDAERNVHMSEMRINKLKNPPPKPEGETEAQEASLNN